MKIDPDFAIAYVDSASTYWNLEDYPAMNDSYQNALRLKFLKYAPESKFSRYLLGRSYFFSNQTEKTIHTWKELAAGRWNWVWVYYFLGDAYLREDKFLDAVKAYKIGIEVSPESIFMYAKLSIAYNGKGEKTSSDFFHKRFLEETRNHMGNADEIYLQSGLGYIENKMHEKVIGSFLEGLSAFPLDECFHRGLGRSYFGAGDYRKARGEFLKAFEIDPGQVKVYFLLGRAYEELKQEGKAVQSYTKYIELQKQGDWAEDTRMRLNRLKGSD